MVLQNSKDGESTSEDLPIGLTELKPISAHPLDFLNNGWVIDNKS
jgi:hypothetical protein